MRLTARFNGARRVVARTILRAVGVAASGRPVPVIVVRSIRAIATGVDPLPARSEPIDGGRLENTDLAAALTGVELGIWALGPRSLDALVQVVAKRRPSLVIEFGSGASTVALAWAVSQRVADDELGRPRVVSLEQDEIQAGRTRGLLRRAGLQAEAVVLVAPLAQQEIEGAWTTCYVTPDEFRSLLDGRQAEFVLIDGPASDSGARFGTLPLVREHLATNTPFVLDDALRDGELEVAQRWGWLAYIRVDGIRLIERGLLTGTVIRQ
jgi:predicted O-methyltransferase YrrM